MALSVQNIIFQNDQDYLEFMNNYHRLSTVKYRYQNYLLVDKSEKHQDTEQRIKEAASKMFHEKGFAATKTRDIAEAARPSVRVRNRSV